MQLKWFENKSRNEPNNRRTGAGRTAQYLPIHITCARCTLALISAHSFGDAAMAAAMGGALDTASMTLSISAFTSRSRFAAARCKSSTANVRISVCSVATQVKGHFMRLLPLAELLSISEPGNRKQSQKMAGKIGPIAHPTSSVMMPLLQRMKSRRTTSCARSAQVMAGPLESGAGGSFSLL